MKRWLVALSMLGLMVAGIVGYRYWQHQQEAYLAAAARAKQDEAKQQEKALLAEAKAWIDEWGGQGDNLFKARANLDRVLRANPRNAEARVQLARFHLASGHISYRNYKRDSLQAAVQELQHARHYDPKAEVDVLSAYISLVRNQPRDAIKALEQAEAGGTKNPSLHVTWAEALVDLNQPQLAESRLRKGQSEYAATESPSVRVLAEFHVWLAIALSHQGRLEEADKEYQAALAKKPSAWRHGNYANFLLFTRGMPDAAIVEAEKALAIMDFGLARQILAAANYAKWAELKSKAPADAEEYSTRAQQLAPDLSWIVSQAASAVQAGPAIQNMVKAFMARGMSIDTKDNNGDTGLTVAAYSGKVQSVILLIKYGANIEAADNNGMTALANAAYKGHTEVVRALVARGAKLNTPSQNSLLNVSVVHGNEEMVRTLVSLKANVNAQPGGGHTPLMKAALAGNQSIARLLLELGADPTEITKDSQQSAADLATASGYKELGDYIRAAAARRKH